MMHVLSESGILANCMQEVAVEGDREDILPPRITVVSCTGWASFNSLLGV